MSLEKIAESCYPYGMQNGVSPNIWPFLVYDRWASFLGLQMQRQEVSVDLLEVLNNPPYEALATGNHCGIIFGVDGEDECPESTEGLFQLWVDRLQPDSAFDIDFLAEVVAMARAARIGESSWTDYDERMSQSRRRPLRHPAPVQSILAETRGFLFYRNQPARILALILDLNLHDVDPLLTGKVGTKMMQSQEAEFAKKLTEFEVSDDYASNLWQLCIRRYRLCLPREFLDSRRVQILWSLAVRQQHPELFREAWSAYNESAI